LEKVLFSKKRLRFKKRNSKTLIEEEVAVAESAEVAVEAEEAVVAEAATEMKEEEEKMKKNNTKTMRMTTSGPQSPRNKLRDQIRRRIFKWMMTTTQLFEILPLIKLWDTKLSEIIFIVVHLITQ
jgi:hypothetical protein